MHSSLKIRDRLSLGDSMQAQIQKKWLAKAWNNNSKAWGSLRSKNCLAWLGPGQKKKLNPPLLFPPVFLEHWNLKTNWNILYFPWTFHSKNDSLDNKHLDILCCIVMLYSYIYVCVLRSRHCMSEHTKYNLVMYVVQYKMFYTQ